MKTLVLLIIGLMLSISCQAATWVVCDPDPTVTGHSWSLDGGPWMDQPYTERIGKDDGVTYSAIADVSSVTPGPHTMDIKAYRVVTDWDRLESETVSYGFDKPRGANPPGNIKLKR